LVVENHRDDEELSCRGVFSLTAERRAEHITLPPQPHKCPTASKANLNWLPDMIGQPEFRACRRAAAIDFA